MEMGKAKPKTVNVFIIGSTSAGKTTLARAITYLVDAPKSWESSAGIDIFEIKMTPCGIMKIYDIAGHDPFHFTHGFFFRATSSFVIYVMDTDRSPSQMEDDAIYWLAFVCSCRCPGDQPPYVIFVGSKEDKGKADVQAKLNSVVKKIHQKFKGRFVFLSEPLALDLRQTDSKEMQLVTRQLVTGAQKCLQVMLIAQRQWVLLSVK